MSLSTHVKHISLNQWRYYYNQLLFIDVPLSANFMQELLRPEGNSPTIEITPIQATDESSAEAYGSDSEPLSLQAQCFEDLATQLPCKNLHRRLIINIYANAVLNKGPDKGSESGAGAVGELGPQTAISAMRSPLSPTVELTQVSETPATTLIGTLSEPLLPTRPKAEIPEPWCQVSALLAGLMAH